MAGINTNQSERFVARVTSVLLRGGRRHEGDPVCWAEIEGEQNGTHYAKPIKFKAEGTFSLNPTFDQYEIMPVSQAPAEIQTFLRRRWANRR